jgi:hypothetical protein
LHAPMRKKPRRERIYQYIGAGPVHARALPQIMDIRIQLGVELPGERLVFILGCVGRDATCAWCNNPPFPCPRTPTTNVTRTPTSRPQQGTSHAEPYQYRHPNHRREPGSRPSAYQVASLAWVWLSPVPVPASAWVLAQSLELVLVWTWWLAAVGVSNDALRSRLATSTISNADWIQQKVRQSDSQQMHRA